MEKLIIAPFMITEYKLKGNALILYSLIFTYTLANGGWDTNREEYSLWTGAKINNSFFVQFRKLHEEGLIEVDPQKPHIWRTVRKEL